MRTPTLVYQGHEYDVMRAQVHGRFLYSGGRKLYLCGVTYGTFAERADGGQYPEPHAVERDFALMRAAGVNAVRTYTPVPLWMLDLAAEHDLHVMAGIPWEEHITFLDDRRTARSIERRVAEAVRRMAGHPALLAYTIGNEIPGGITRWHGRRRTERFIERLYHTAKDVDPEGLVTYVNYPTTEYLQLPFVDFLSFNVYLEHQPELERYLARLHNMADEKPLVMAEIGLDSRRNGEDVQATVLEWQVGTAFRSGCAGAFVFAWTDEWHRGGYEVDDWDFGLVDRARRPKRALVAVSRAFERLHHDEAIDWPRISVVVCSHNGERWLPGCIEALRRVDYPQWETIVVSDGSTDRTAEIARQAGLRVVADEVNRGLSAARNRGLEAATGEIVAYVDDDARPDPDWLRYLALAFERSSHAAIGGPNLPPAGDGDIADCIAHAPGGPVHVLMSDDLAEHVPGCNTAVRREALASIGGFDPTFRIAGDDVDMCWRLQDAGYTVGFSPAAMVWHHRRTSVRTYLRQQYQYGRAEGLLEAKWPTRYNRLGHLSWAGRIYGAGARMTRARRRARVGYGTWGTSLFQSIYEPAPTMLASLALMPEWYIAIVALMVLSLLGAVWSPLLLAVPLLVMATTVVVVRSFVASGRSHDPTYAALGRRRRAKLRLLTTALHVVQPAARLAGRFREGLHPWRRRCARRFAVPRWRLTTIWSELWRPPDAWPRSLEVALTEHCPAVRRGADFDRWDLEVRGGPFGVVRLLCAVEEHGAGRQLVRVRSWPRVSRGGVALAGACAVLGGLAVLDGASVVGLPALAAAAGLVVASVYDCTIAMGVLVRALGAVARETATDAGQSAAGAGAASNGAAPDRVADVAPDRVADVAPNRAIHAAARTLAAAAPGHAPCGASNGGTPRRPAPGHPHGAAPEPIVAERSQRV